MSKAIKHPYKTFAVFSYGSVKLYKDFKLFPDNFIQVGSNELVPIEDYGDYVLLDYKATEEQAWEEFLKAI